MFRRAQSIRGRLFAVFGFLLLLVICLGLESLLGLSHSNEVSAQVRIRWLPSTRALGDLNNYTTDFPAVAAAILRSRDAGERDLLRGQLGDLERGVADAGQAYLRIHHDSAEDQLYEQFRNQWNAYQAVVDRIAASEPQHTGYVQAQAIEMSARSAYAPASRTLGLLTDRNMMSAAEASARSEQAYAQARKRIVLTVLLAGLLVAGAMAHVTRLISAPLVDLAQRMHRLAADETTVEILGTSRGDEIGEMARAVVVFRNNAIDLAQNRHALARQASMLTEKLAEEQRLTQLQRNFVSMASHEFRTPLGIIDGHAQRLVTMKDRLSGNDLAERARKIRSAVQRMIQLIDNLIGSARLIDARIELYYHPAHVDLIALLREVCQLQRELTPHVQILEPLTPEPLPVHGDASLLRQLFGNLLSNAVKYSPAGGLIRLRAEREAGMSVVAIRDTGIGIPDRDRVHVFERYYRGSNASAIAGTGVGLYLVSKIVDLHAGAIEVESSEGHGSTFTVRLPCAGYQLARKTAAAIS